MNSSPSKYIGAARRKETQVLLFEKDADLRADPLTCTAIPMHMDDALREHGLGEETLDCILSGLPLQFPAEAAEYAHAANYPCAKARRIIYCVSILAANEKPAAAKL
ncbi:hypothetical protein P4H66_00175 [Paenibacillus dokdonensis]|uniref:Uncharacterized protein n=1 Tax=Paenibacillus dokdonensis TaxID=2567944 RepID=A0ABU6GHU6_9BACL|nr:hypothetical protein [Paenibacillus dokdonensis]MEC0238285.1 hypothetical protein [Paenibacillus dokdonensis]